MTLAGVFLPHNSNLEGKNYSDNFVGKNYATVPEYCKVCLSVIGIITARAGEERNVSLKTRSIIFVNIFRQ